MGKGGFVWWHGVVEDRNDPLQLGRCRVRILGWHPESKTMLKTEELPWAFPMQDITSAAMSGIGYAPVGPVEGTWVMGFFRDGESGQEPVMLGTFGGIPGTPLPQEGFSDPNKKYPLQNELFHGLDEPDTNRLARTRGINILGKPSKEHPVVTQKVSPAKLENYPGQPVEVQVPKALSKATWSEPLTLASNSKYPFNHVFETESGHIQEFDDTPGFERTHWWHRAGTFEEVHPSGDRVSKVVGENFEIVYKNDNLRVKGDLNITVDQRAKLRVNGLVDIEVVQDDIRIVVKQGNAEVQVQQGNASVLVQGNLAFQVNGNMTEKVVGDYNVEVGGTYRLRAGTVFIRGGSIFLN